VAESGPSSTSESSLLLGADVGGTTTRVAVATVSGDILAVAAGPAGNPNAVGLDVSAQRIRAAAEQCLGQVGSDAAGLVRAMVVGLAGGSRADETFLSAATPGGTAAPDGRGVRARLVSDLSVAFSSATAAPEGYVLVAGTGAVAGHLVDGELLERRDGWGWLLGDEGSGFWLGREAVRSTLATLQSHQPLGPLAEAVVRAAGSRDPVELVQLCYANPPIWLASFGHLVSRHAEDRAARDIADRAADHLLTTLLGLDLVAGLPLVLAGSVATRPGPVADALARRLRKARPDPVLVAESGLVGALWLAARQAGVRDEQVHARLARSPGRTSSTVV